MHVVALGQQTLIELDEARPAALDEQQSLHLRIRQPRADGARGRSGVALARAATASDAADREQRPGHGVLEEGRVEHRVQQQRQEGGGDADAVGVATGAAEQRHERRDDQREVDELSRSMPCSAATVIGMLWESETDRARFVKWRLVLGRRTSPSRSRAAGGRSNSLMPPVTRLPRPLVAPLRFC